MLLELKPFQVKAAELIAARYAFFINHADRPWFKKNKPRPFYQALSAITGAGKTPILAEAVSLMTAHMTLQPIVFWMSKAKSVVGQTYNNFIEGGKYSEIVEDFKVLRAGELEPSIISDGSQGLIVLATTGLFNNKEQSDGKLNIYKRDEDKFGKESAWERLIARNAGGQRRPLVVVYDEGHNLSDQQTSILSELEPDAYLLASATLQLPASFDRAVRIPVVDWVMECEGNPKGFAEVQAVDAAGNPDAHLFVTTTVDSNAVVQAELIKTAIQFDGTTAPMERCLDELHHRLNLIQHEIDAHGLSVKPKAIYVCKTNINDDGEKDDIDKPFAQRNAPPIRIWRYLVDVKKVNPKTIAIYADLKFKDNKPDEVNLFSKGESDFDDFQAGNFQHIIFNLGLQEGWDDPACYLGYVDKSMGSKIRVEQIIGRVLRQFDAKHYSSPLLNSAHFFLRVDKENVFTTAVAAVKQKLQQDGTAIEIFESYGSGAGASEDLLPKKGQLPKAIIHPVNKDASSALAEIKRLIKQFPTFDPDSIDAKGKAVAAKEVVDLTKLDGPEKPIGWSPDGETNRVRMRWLVNNAIRAKSSGALAAVNLQDSKFDVRVQAQSNAHTYADKLASDLVHAYYSRTDLVYEKRAAPFTFSTMRVPKKGPTYTNGLYARYAGMNKFEKAFADALDQTGELWHRNQSGSGFWIPLLSEGDTAKFFPDFLVWKGKYIYCLDTKGGHLLSDAVARKLFNISDGPTLKLLNRFITEGKQDQLRGKAIKGGYTVWKLKSGSPTPILVDTLEDAVKESLKL